MSSCPPAWSTVPSRKASNRSRTIPASRPKNPRPDQVTDFFGASQRIGRCLYPFLLKRNFVGISLRHGALLSRLPIDRQSLLRPVGIRNGIFRAVVGALLVMQRIVRATPQHVHLVGDDLRRVAVGSAAV